MLEVKDLQNDVVYVVTKPVRGVPAGTLVSAQNNDVVMSTHISMPESAREQLQPEDVRPATLKDVRKAMVE